jgi:hypothetical protein
VIHALGDDRFGNHRLDCFLRHICRRASQKRPLANARSWPGLPSPSRIRKLPLDLRSWPPKEEAIATCPALDRLDTS